MRRARHPARRAGGRVGRAAARARASMRAALPLIGIAPPPTRAPVRAAWARTAALRAGDVRQPERGRALLRRAPGGQRGWPAGTRWPASPGPGTSRALRAAGVPADRHRRAGRRRAAVRLRGAVGSSCAARDWRGAQVLVVRGDGGRDWLADTLRGPAPRVELRARPTARRAASSTTPQRAPARRGAGAAARRTLWLFSSSEAIDHLQRAGARRPTGARPGALATHPRIAERARELGFGRVLEAPPDARRRGGLHTIDRAPPDDRPPPRERRPPAPDDPRRRRPPAPPRPPPRPRRAALVGWRSSRCCWCSAWPRWRWPGRPSSACASLEQELVRRQQDSAGAGHRGAHAGQAGAGGHARRRRQGRAARGARGRGGDAAHASSRT